jgi:hypothetical protein
VSLLPFLLGFIVQAEFTVIQELNCRHKRVADFCVGLIRKYYLFYSHFLWGEHQSFCIW